MALQQIISIFDRLGLRRVDWRRDNICETLRTHCLWIPWPVARNRRRWNFKCLSFAWTPGTRCCTFGYCRSKIYVYLDCVRGSTVFCSRHFHGSNNKNTKTFESVKEAKSIVVERLSLLDLRHGQTGGLFWSQIKKVVHLIKKKNIYLYHILASIRKRKNNDLRVKHFIVWTAAYPLYSHMRNSL